MYDAPVKMTPEQLAHAWEWEAKFWHWQALNQRPVWWYRPGQIYNRWSPLWLGSDEYYRRTLVIGWGFTGQLVVALWHCRCDDCKGEIAELDRWLETNDPS